MSSLNSPETGSCDAAHALKVLMVTAEYAPFVKTGGLADAVAGLSSALSSAGHDVRILLPDYASASLPDTVDEPYSLADNSTLRRADIESPTQVFAHTRPNEPDSKVIYTGDQRDGERFVGLAEAAAAFATATKWRPDVIHCHDWHAALVPDALKVDGDEQTPTILTLHNIGYQGSFGNAVLASANSKKLVRRLSSGNEPLNFLRRGIAAADIVSTVSPTYAREILSPQYGMGLEDSIARRAGVLFGILNGVDYGTWDPRVDPFIESHYSEPDPAAKRAIKAELCERTDLSSAIDRPVIGIVSRLAEQKGIDIFSAALDRLIAETDAAFVILGSGNPDLERDLRTREAQFPGRVAFRSGHDESLAHSIIAGSDYLLIPSRYEPCGLTQLYALRYGTIPIVRKTGGLADTVEHFDPATGKGNGCVFNDPDVGAILWAVDTALHWYRDSEIWQTLRTNAMSEDHSWSQRVDSYVNLYSRLLQLTG